MIIYTKKYKMGHNNFKWNISEERGIEIAHTLLIEILNEFGSTSANIGTAPTYKTAKAVAINVKGGTITSSPGSIPNATKDACNADVPEFNAIAYFE